MKKCSRCSEDKPLSSFGKNTNTKDGYRYVCKTCSKEYNRKYNSEHKQAALDNGREWKLKNPDKVRDIWIKYHYKLSSDEYRSLIGNQGNRCAVCDLEFSDSNIPFVDHDHTCCLGNKSCGSCVRGLLCRHCNTALGFLRDDPRILKKAIAYLETGR